MPSFVPLPPEIEEQAVALYKEGYGMAKISSMLRVAHHKVQKLIMGRGIARNKKEAFLKKIEFNKGKK